MYAIRSYYGRDLKPSGSRSNMFAFGRGKPDNASGWGFLRPVIWNRITSYNVCYTKLLRIKQKNEIDSVKKTFYPIGNFSYKFPGWDKLIKKETNNSTTPATTVPTDAKIPEENIKSFQEVNEILASSFLKTNLPTSITNGAGLQIGLMGHFKITWGNVEGGIYAGVYITADTNLDISKTLVEYPSNEIRNNFV